MKIFCKKLPTLDTLAAMNRKPTPWSFPMLRFPYSLVDEGEEERWLSDVSGPSGLSVSEDGGYIYVEAAVPGLKPDEIEITFDQGILWIKGEKKEEAEDKSKKFYRKSMSSFSYRVAVPGNIDEARQPEAEYLHGMVQIRFSKAKPSQPKKIPIKSS